MIEGQFIVVEGTDGSGTTTQCQRLAEALREQGLPVHTTCEPSGGPIGSMIRQILSGRMVVHGHHGTHAPSWMSMAALFTADRYDHLDAEVLPNLADGVTVICDRYDYSTVAYQSLSSGQGKEAIPWLTALNEKARRPDLTLVLDVEPEVAASRRAGRSEERELYEESTLQEKLCNLYKQIDKHFPGDTIEHIDASAEADEVAAKILARVLEARGQGAPR